ncbi:MAG: hypothetical protein M0Q38_04930 [Bacteroidales bacterium]|jgi:hypothetical protein|nr:hypothetical protein [Bacteroidales bacterium]
MKKILIAIIFFLVFFDCPLLNAQDEKVFEEIKAQKDSTGVTLNFGADIMSLYIWRGYDIGNSPAIQPNLNFSWNGLNIGAWGSYAFAKHTILINDSTYIDAGNYAEVDLYISYTFKWFTLMVFDYFIMNGLNSNEGNRYFDYNNKTTGHTFEGTLSFDGTDTFPLQLIVSTLFYGDDKDKDSTGVYGLGTKNNFSTYFEASYTFNIDKIGVEIKPFIGGTPFGSSWYGPKAGVTNIGMTAQKTIEITKTYSLPVQVSLITNPQAQSAFLVFGISL